MGKRNWVFPAMVMGRRGQGLLAAIASIGLLVSDPLPGQAEPRGTEDRLAHINLDSHISTLAQATVPSPASQVPRHRIRLRRGPYFPDLNTLTPPFPDPIFPEIVYPMRLVIRLSHRRVYVYRGDEVHTSYPIAVGKPGWETPIGEYTITNMQENPVWRNPFNGNLVPAGANNPLGDRWIGFWTDGSNVIGFHGTPNESSVGQAASHGCVRMLNRDVRALYAIAELGMPVIVEP